jgi:predicted dehydrogenase
VGFTIVPRRVLGGPGHTPPSEQLTKAIIGVGGMGRGHIGYAGTPTLAVCDVDRNHAREAAEEAGPDCAVYHDFREVLARPDIDIIHVATPPHWHALIAIAAARAGKDIWCEKPLTRTIGEGEALVRAVRQTGRVLRINTWFRLHSDLYGSGYTCEDLRKVCDHGLLGWPLKCVLSGDTGFDWKVDMWAGQTHHVPEPIPEHFDYDFWLGPAPMKPYHPHRTHGTFRGYWDYDGGGLGDMSQHYVDPFQYILKKDDESPVEIIPDTQQQHYDAVRPWRSVRLVYADGCEILFDNGQQDHPPLLEGPAGRLYPNWKTDVPGLTPRAVRALPDLREPQITDFLESVRTRRPFGLNEANGHRSCTLVNLAKIALRLGRPLRFDDATQRFIHDEQANHLIHQPMRPPWTLEGVSA